MKRFFRFGLVFVFLVTTLLGMPGRVLAAPDVSAPITTLIVFGPSGPDGWYLTPVRIAMTAIDPGSDASGVAYSEYSLNNAPWQTFTESFVLEAGDHWIQYRSVDLAGNVEAIRSTHVRVDMQGPVITGWFEYPSITREQTQIAYFTATDALSGVASVTAVYNGSPITSGTTIPMTWLSTGTNVMTVTAMDYAGNTSVQSFSFEVVADLESLRATIRRMCTEKYILNAGLCRAFDNKLALAIQMRKAGKLNQVSYVLSQLIQEVRVQTSKPRNVPILPAAASVIIQDATYILQHLGK